ncbi:MAG: glycerol kinase GlpK [Erysipelotrichaceae bacterium]|nr:glycerol kinase GlpK [Erysipelotrichaceae bacterium]
MSAFICAVDQGTSSSRSIIFDKSLNIISIGQRELPSYYPQPSWVEQNAEEIFASVVSVISESLIKARLSGKDLKAIAITNQRETTIIWDKKTGDPVYFALVWQSRQTSDLCEEKRKKGYEPLFRRKTGLVLDPYFSASKIRFILDHIPMGQERAENNELCFGTVDTWLSYKLSLGKIFKTDVSNASRTLLMNIETCQWDEELCHAWNIPMSILPEIVDTSEIIGEVDASFFGAAIPIAALVGDQQAALFGQLCLSEGDVKNTYGTGCFILMNTGSQRIQSKHGLLSTVAWRFKGETTYALEGSVFVAGSAIQWLKEGIGLIRHSEDTERICHQVKDTHGVVVVPTFVGLGAPYWKSDVQGAIFGLTQGSNDQHIIRATLESIAFQSSDVIMAMEKDAKQSIKKLKVDGGASRNDFIMQFQADLLHTEVVRPLISETTALGAAMLAGLAIGVYKSTADLSKVWKTSQIFKPQMDEKTRKEKLERWRMAINAVTAFKCDHHEN